MKEGCTASGSAEVVNGSRYLHGARVGIVAKPSAEFVGAILGTWLRGGVAVPLAISYPESELLHVMNDSVCTAHLLFMYVSMELLLEV